MKQDFLWQARDNACMWRQLKKQLIITYLRNENHYWMAFQARSSIHGAEQFARIRGFITTVRKQGLSIIKTQ